MIEFLEEHLERHYPGLYKVASRPAGGSNTGVTEYCVATVAEAGAHGAVFQYNDVMAQDHGIEAAAQDLCAVVDRVIAQGLPEQRLGEYIGYDAS
ncbi:hypothetical protein [Deinococcus sp. QL22]|uniref:hypothetical protein n=1 Tax=Deinococcus sp. QL22 TaxID=2939437 RepID=UPI002017FCA6|nr:hypothetical protein [Deinococcus sp. QL22]UQN09278.1 hypothetical protein M1R55_22145 [Deinococcus sp. QL22]